MEEDDNQQFFLYVAAFIALLIFGGIGFWKQDGIMLTIGGMLAMIIGINIFINGFPNLTNTFLRNGITTIVWGVGAYLIAKGIEIFINEANE